MRNLSLWVFISFLVVVSLGIVATIDDADIAEINESVLPTIYPFEQYFEADFEFLDTPVRKVEKSA